MGIQEDAMCNSIEWEEYEVFVTESIARELDNLIVDFKLETELDGWEVYEGVIRAGLRRIGLLGVSDGRVNPNIVGRWVAEKTINMGTLPDKDNFERRVFIVRKDFADILRGFSVECGRLDLPSEREVFTALVQLGFDELNERGIIKQKIPQQKESD